VNQLTHGSDHLAAVHACWQGHGMGRLHPSGRRGDSRFARAAKLATAAFLAFGSKPSHAYGSTDSNVPMSLGIPAITLPRVGKSDRTPALEEWMDTDPESNQLAKSIVLTTILAVAGMESPHRRIAVSPFFI
jgi:hypothetical protein